MGMWDIFSCIVSASFYRALNCSGTSCMERCEGTLPLVLELGRYRRPKIPSGFGTR